MRYSKPMQVNELLLLFVKEFRLEQGLLENRALCLWDEVMGMNVAKATVSKKIQNRKLYISLSSSVVRHELFMMRSEIVQELNRRLGTKLLDELVLK